MKQKEAGLPSFFKRWLSEGGQSLGKGMGADIGSAMRGVSPEVGRSMGAGLMEGAKAEFTPMARKIKDEGGVFLDKAKIEIGKALDKGKELLHTVPDTAERSAERVRDVVTDSLSEAGRSLSTAAMVGAGTGALTSPTGQAPEGAIRGAVGG